jgi:hypothetical protein
MGVLDRGFAPWHMAAVLHDSIGRWCGVLGKRAREVVGVNEHCFEVMWRRGTHHGSCSMMMAVGWRGAPVRGQPTVASSRVRCWVLEKAEVKPEMGRRGLASEMPSRRRTNSVSALRGNP